MAWRHKAGGWSTLKAVRRFLGGAPFGIRFFKECGFRVNLMQGFDRFGNRWQQNGPTNTFLATFTGNNPGNPQNNNRIDGYTHDAAGNIMNDGSHSYTYDAEN